jgi:hypothetical protein
MAFTIVKQIAGGVIILDFKTKQVLKELTEDAVLLLSNRSQGGGVWIIDKEANEFFLQTSQIINSQVLPLAALPFSGDSRDAYELLEQDFFYNLVNQAPPAGGGAFEDLSESEAFLEQSTNSTTYQNALTLLVNLIEGERYKFSFNYNLQVNRTNRSGLVRCYIEAPSSLETEISELSSEMKDNTNYLPFSPWRYITATETGSYTVKLDFRCELNNMVVRIKECSIEVLKKA